MGRKQKKPTPNPGGTGAFRSSKRGKKTRERCCLFSVRVHTVLLQTEWMLAKQAYSRGVLRGPC